MPVSQLDPGLWQLLAVDLRKTLRFTRSVLAGWVEIAAKSNRKGTDIMKKSKLSAKTNKRNVSRSATKRLSDLTPRKEPKGGVGGIHYKKSYIVP